MAIEHLKRAVSLTLDYAARGYARVRRRSGASGRRLLGVGFVIGGFLAVLPVFGLWMLPVGLALLSDDVPPLRRTRRRWHAQLLAWSRGRRRQRGGAAPAAAPARSD